MEGALLARTESCVIQAFAGFPLLARDVQG
jgi:hypothetical protein